MFGGGRCPQRVLNDLKRARLSCGRTILLLAQHPPVRKLDRRHTGRLRNRDNLLYLHRGYGGRGWARSHIIRQQEAWPYIKHSILSECPSDLGSAAFSRRIQCIHCIFFVIFSLTNTSADEPWRTFHIRCNYDFWSAQHNTEPSLINIANSTTDNEQFKLKSTVSVKCCGYSRCTSTLNRVPVPNAPEYFIALLTAKDLCSCVFFPCNNSCHAFWGCIRRKTWCTATGPSGADYNSPYLIVNSVVSYLPPTTMGKGWSGEHLSYWLTIFVSFCLIPKPVFYVNTSTEKEEGKGRADLMSLNMEHGQPHAWVDFNPTPQQP